LRRNSILPVTFQTDSRLGGVLAPGRATGGDGLLVSTCLCLAITGGFAVWSSEFLHWFIVPVTLCGAIVGEDAVEWVRGRMDLFDPAGLVGLFGAHFFFLTPLLHVGLDFWMYEVEGPPDWRPWLGAMAVLNFLGLLVYRSTRSHFGSPGRTSPTVPWRLAPDLFRLSLYSFLVLSVAVQIVVYARFGGISGFVASFENGDQAFAGMGWMFMIGESFPILVAIGYVVRWRRSRTTPSWQVAILFLAGFVVIKLFFGGIRGSRSNIVFTTFWVVGMFHFWIRRIPRSLFLAGLPLMMLFMYVYGFYKSGGREGLEAAMSSAEARADLEIQYKRSLEGAVLGDFGRSDVQAYLLYRSLEPESDVVYAWGRTYLWAMMLIIPKNIWPDRPDGAKFGTEAIYGRGSYDLETFRSSRIHGLAGEAILNFGFWAVPIAFGLLGMFVGRVRRFVATCSPDDVRRLLLPILTILCIVIVSCDLGNVIFFCMQYVLVPAAAICLGAMRQRSEGATALSSHRGRATRGCHAHACRGHVPAAYGDASVATAPVCATRVPLDRPQPASQRT
jgi:hypothetical protein